MAKYAVYITNVVKIIVNAPDGDCESAACKAEKIFEQKLPNGNGVEINEIIETWVDER